MLKPIKSLILAAAILLPAGLTAQYNSDRPLEMTFEQSDFFFSPSFLNPLGSENFKSASVLTSEQPLISLQRNPANLSRFDRDTLTSNYFYLDFRNNLDIVNQSYGFYPGYRLYSPGYRYPGWGYYHTSARAELTPLVSAAWLTRLPVLNNSITLGATYQLITQAGGYYAIPHDIYRNQAGRSLDGMAYAGTEGYEITDRFSGSDDMYHEGHAMNLFLAWEINEALEMGFKIGGFLFDRDGSLGSDNLWNQQAGYTSYWKTHEQRDQEYGHMDYSLGVNYTTGNNKFGLFGGLVQGEVIQNMVRDDESMSRYGIRDGTNWSNYNNWHQSDQNWDHTGNTFYSGFQWERQMREDLSFRLMYNYSLARQDLGLASDIESESDNEYYYHYNNGQFSESEGFSIMHDFRTGSGDRDIKSSTLKSAMNWDVDEKQNLSVGAIFGVRRQSTNTIEKVDAFSESFYHQVYFYGNDTTTWTQYNKTVEDKTINWEFASRLRSIQIPVIYEYDLNERWDFLIGLNRVMNFWKIENKTLVLYDYRERVQNEEVKIEEMTGERITMPRERLSIITTSFLGGVTFSPSGSFSIQLIASPGFEKNSIVDERRVGMQFWLSMTLRP